MRLIEKWRYETNRKKLIEKWKSVKELNPYLHLDYTEEELKYIEEILLPRLARKRLSEKDINCVIKMLRGYMLPDARLDEPSLEKDELYREIRRKILNAYFRYSLEKHSLCSGSII